MRERRAAMQDPDEVTQPAKLSRSAGQRVQGRRDIATEAAFVQRAEPMRGGLLPGQIKPGNGRVATHSSDSPKEAHKGSGPNASNEGRR